MVKKINVERKFAPLKKIKKEVSSYSNIDELLDNIYLHDSVKLGKEEKIWELSVNGYTQRSIAEMLKISLNQVGSILNKLYAEHSQKLAEQIPHFFTQQIALYEKIIEYSLKAWRTQKKLGVKDSSYLTTAMTAMENMRKIRGVPSPSYEHNSDNKSDGLSEIMAILDGARERKDRKNPA